VSATLALVALSGLAAGAAHVVTGIDHLAALLPLSVGRRFHALRAGVRWGLGHSGGVLVVGALALALEGSFDVEALSHRAEAVVGLVLVVIGGQAIRAALRLKVHVHPHAHEGEPHAHLHAHLGEAPAAAADHPHPHRHEHTAFVAGTLHGFAGTAHLLGVLPAVALPGLGPAALYLLAFAVGTILAMAAFAALVGEASARAAQDRPVAARGLLLAAGLATTAVGGVWAALALAGPISW
jgi:hypothetical protein